jgi:DNA helicase HerA-like ATPase
MKKPRRKRPMPRKSASPVERPGPEGTAAQGIVLGWRLDSGGEPAYWMSGKRAKRGAQSDSDLVVIPRVSFGTNTIIVAQSGSGKTSFLARIVEELCLNSSSRCLIIDPNSDYRYFRESANKADWTAAAYDPRTHSGKLFTERSASEFKRRWAKIKNQITILAGGIREDISTAAIRMPTVSWRFLPSDFLMDGLDSVHRVEMRHCHTFFRNLAGVCETVFRLKSHGTSREARRTVESFDVLHIIEPVFAALAEARSAGRLHGDDSVAHLLDVELDQRMQLPEGRSYSEARDLWRQIGSRKDFYLRRIARNLERATIAFGFFTEGTGRYYFGLLEDLRAEGILNDRLEDPEARRIEILDLPTVKLRTSRNLLVASFLDRVIARATLEWETARSTEYIDPETHYPRHPFFVILDEAHNLIPGDESASDPSLKLVRDRFRMIAAEGRKLGLFLILATQRPDKIDKFVLSECQNRAVLRHDNEASLAFASEALGMQDAMSVMRKRCLGRGYRVVLAGRWTNYSPVPMYPAPRRTLESGGSLEAEDWIPRPPEVDEGRPESTTSVT